MRKLSLFLLLLCSLAAFQPTHADTKEKITPSAPNLKKLPCDGWSTEELVNAAHEGNFNAQMELARYWLLRTNPGDPVTRDTLEANHWSRVWLEKAAKSDHPAPKLYLEFSGDHPAPGENLLEDDKILVSECEKSAEQGDIESIQALGILLPPPDDALLEQWYKPLKKKADAGNAHSAAILAKALLFGHATNEKYIAEGLKYAQQAAKSGDTGGMTTYGRALLLGLSGSDQTEQALRWLNKAADLGHIGAIETLLSTVRDENDFANDQQLQQLKNRETQLTKTLLDRGQLGILISHGTRLVETGESPLTGLKLLDRAADMGSLTALDSLAKYYQDNGYFVPANTEKAVAYAQRLADFGNPCGLLKLASYHERGHGMPKNPDKAYSLVCDAKKSGFPDATVEEARMIMKGLGTDPDPQRAYLILKKLSEQDAPPISLYFLLGYMYEGGIGTPQNLPAAHDLYTKGAKAGDHKSMNNLASMYETGTGVAKDTKQAKKWYEEAAKQGNEEAATNLSRLKETSL